MNIYVQSTLHITICVLAVCAKKKSRARGGSSPGSTSRATETRSGEEEERARGREEKTVGEGADRREVEE